MSMGRRTRRWLLAAALLPALLLIPLLRGGVDPLSGFIMRSAEELASLRALLRSETAWPPLASLAEAMVLWRVETRTLPAPPESGCQSVSTPPGGPEKIRHTFEFASRKAGAFGSSRVYRVSFLSCKRSAGAGEGDFVMEVERAGFGSDFRLDPQPLVSGLSPLKVLRLAMEDPLVAGDLVETLKTEDIAYCAVLGEDGGKPAAARFRFIAANGPPGKPSTTLELHYLAEYDSERESASFIRLP